MKKIIQILSSMKFALVILILIIIASIIGTFLSQDIASKYVYYSWWYIGLMIFLVISTVLCIIKQIPVRKGKIGIVILHMGIPIILIGSLITMNFRESGYIQIYEKESRDIAVHDNGSYFRIPFFIYLDDFEIEYFPDGSIRNYKSKLIIITSEGQKIKEKTIEVNKPLSYKGYKVYQFSYDQKNMQWTGLYINNDPGVIYVYSGAFILIIGLFVRIYEKILYKIGGQ